MRQKRKEVPTYLAAELSNEVVQILSILSNEEKDLFEDYYKPFITMPDIPPEFPYHILKVIITQPLSKAFLYDKEVANALSAIERMTMKKTYLPQ